MLIPPSLLTSSTANWAAFNILLPSCAIAPDNGATSPTFIVSSFSLGFDWQPTKLPNTSKLDNAIKDFS